MKTKVKFKKGKNVIEFDDAQSNISISLLREFTFVDLIKREVEEIARHAEKNWPVRMEKYGKSQGSKNQFVTGVRIIPPNRLEAFVENRAEYAWAIRAGAGSDTTVKEGARVADVLLWKPAQKRAKQLVIKGGAQAIRKIKKVVK